MMMMMMMKKKKMKLKMLMMVPPQPACSGLLNQTLHTSTGCTTHVRHTYCTYRNVLNDRRTEPSHACLLLSHMCARYLRIPVQCAPTGRAGEGTNDNVLIHVDFIKGRTC